jgi:membrane protein DedA with SNARE-associated domain
MLEQILAVIVTYPGLFALCTMTGLLIPVPEDVVVVWSGMMISDGRFGWAGTLAAVCLGTYVRDIITYWLGRGFGHWLMRRRAFVSMLGPNRIRRAQKMFEVRGSAAVFIGRFMVGMRVPLFFMAGTLGLSFRRFALWDALGMLPASFLLIWLGARFGHPIFDTLRTFSRGTSWTLATVLVVGGGAVWWLKRRQAKNRRADAAEFSTSVMEGSSADEIP